MKISVDDKELYTLSDTQKKVICDYLSEDIFDADMKRRLQWVLMHLYEQAYIEMKKNWEDRLAKRCDSIPTDPDKMAELIFSQPDYQSKCERDKVLA